MRFKSFIINEMLGDPDYKLPKDKEKALFDFYMLSLIKGNDKNPKQGEFNNEDKINYTLNDVASKLLPELKNNLLHATFFSITAETRHIFDGNTSQELMDTVKYLGIKYEKGLKKYAKNFVIHDTPKTSLFARKPEIPHRDIKDDIHTDNSRMSSYYAALNCGLSQPEFVYMAQILFDEAQWSSSYGGDAWANICKGWLKLNNANSEGDMFVWIDHVFDLAHNTGTVLNKVKSYAKDGNFEWIKKALDFKLNSKDAYELIDRVSFPMRKLALRVIKAKTGKSYEQFLNDKIEKKDEPDKQNSGKVVLPATDKIKSFLKKKYIELDGNPEVKMARLLFSYDEFFDPNASIKDKIYKLESMIKPFAVNVNDAQDWYESEKLIEQKLLNLHNKKITINNNEYDIHISHLNVETKVAIKKYLEINHPGEITNLLRKKTNYDIKACESYTETLMIKHKFGDQPITPKEHSITPECKDQLLRQFNQLDGIGSLGIARMILNPLPCISESLNINQFNLTIKQAAEFILKALNKNIFITEIIENYEREIHNVNMLKNFSFHVIGDNIDNKVLLNTLKTYAGVQVKLSLALEHKILNLMDHKADGIYVNAIKLFREKTNYGLLPSKNYIKLLDLRQLAQKLNLPKI